MDKLHVFISAMGGIFFVLLLAERYLAAKGKGKSKITSSWDNEEKSFEKTKNKTSFKKIRLLIIRISLAAAVVYFGASLFTKSVNLMVIGFLMIIYSSVMAKIINE